MKTKILYAPGFGAGFYTWNKRYPEVIRDEFIIWIIEKKWIEEAKEEIEEYLNEKYDGDFCTWGVEDLEICELEEGTRFYIDEYDGHESVITDEIFNFVA